MNKQASGFVGLDQSQGCIGMVVEGFAKGETAAVFEFLRPQSTARTFVPGLGLLKGRVASTPKEAQDRFSISFVGDMMTCPHCGEPAGLNADEEFREESPWAQPPRLPEGFPGSADRASQVCAR